MADAARNEPDWAASNLDDHPALANREATGAAAVAALRELIRPGEAFVLVDEGFLNITRLVPERTCLRFGDGWLSGTEEPVAQEFELLRASGARYFIFAWPALWWLEFHRTVRDRLRAAATDLHIGDGYIAFDLFDPPPPEATPQSTRNLWLSRVREIVRSRVPPGAIVAVVSKGDDTLLDLGATAGWHFPQLPDGAYAGYPDDSEDAVARLEALRSKGARFLLIPGWAAWWLDHYDGFRRHLKASAERAWSDDDCILYDLSANA